MPENEIPPVIRGDFYFPQKSIINADGQRISKTVDGVTTEFIYAGDILAGQKTGDNVLMWIYDNNGAYIGFTYNGVEYYYVYNLQGDVEAITDSTGAIVAKYGYDTWGEVETTWSAAGTGNIAQINPIRYRGYYYDSERGLYYLNSRYYDPFMCRFLNADGYVSGVGGDVQGYNLFAYCMNNPVNMSDSTGQWPLNSIVSFVKKVVKYVVASTLVNHIVNSINKKNIDKEVQKSYTKESAKEEIDTILNKYGDDVNSKFTDSGVEIKNSVKVTSRYDRQKISTIITRTENLTSREYDDLSAEWELHNILYGLHINRESAVHAFLDYDGDDRWYVVVATDLLEFFGRE